MANIPLLASQTRVQIPFVRVTIGNYTFGAFSRTKAELPQDKDGFYKAVDIRYPNYIQGLNITKINGKVNQYQLSLVYPVTSKDDPNFIEKVLSSVSSTRKIIFSYGDMSAPSFIYKNEEAIITSVTNSFNLTSSTISYNIQATSTSCLGLSGSYTFIHNEPKQPSEEIKRVFRDDRFGLKSLFTGMNESNLSKLIDSSDKKVMIPPQTNISILDYISFLVSCMIPKTSTNDNISSEMYILTIHDNTVYNNEESTPDLINGKELTGPYFKVTQTSYKIAQSDAYVIDVGYNTSTVVTDFNVSNQENYSLFYDYQGTLNPERYVRRLNNNGMYEDVYAPASTSKNSSYITNPNDITWWTKITKYPINATIKILGLLRPAILMSYVRLNVIFPGGNKHISSGLYIVTRQQDTLGYDGYFTTLSLTRIGGDSGSM